MTMADLTDRVQSVLGDAYRVERELPPGGMSRLFLATERSLDRRVVIKVLPPELASEVSAARFQREVTLAAHLQHPHILPVLSAGSRDGLLYYITPFVEGESLRQRLDRETRLPVATAVRILTETADALARAHAAGVVHRDIKPENILLQDRHALLADFGVARALHEATGSDRLTEAGSGVGTPGYMAPEQLAGERHVDARADVYALAVVGYEMLAGRSPFTGATPQAVAAAHFTSAPPPLSQLRPDVPRPISDAIAKALAKDPDGRFATAAEFRDVLVATAPPPASRARRIAGWAGAAALVIVIVTALVWRARPHAPATIDENLVAVEPFTVLDPALDVWRDGMVDVLAHNLDGAGPLRTVSPTVIVHRAHDAGMPPADLARQLGAGLAVTGRIERSGTDSVRVSASFIDAATGRPGEEVAYRGRVDHMDVVTDTLTVALLRSLARTQTVGVARGSLAGAKSLPALKALLESEQAFRRGAWDSAQKAAQEAIRLDSTFALAYYWGSFAEGWAHGTDTNAVAYARLAQANNHGLSPRDSLLIASNAQLDDYQYWNYHDQAQMFALAEAGVKRYPDDPQVWNNLGEVREHAGLGPRVGVAPRAVLDAFAHAIALDSNFAPAYVHAISRSLQVMGADSGLRYARRFLALNPPSVDAEATRLQILLIGHSRDTLAAHHLIDSTSPDVLVRAYFNLHAIPDSAESDVWLAAAIVRRFGPETLVGGPPAAALFEVASADRGHVRAMRQRIRATTKPLPPRIAAAVAIVGSLGIFPVAELDSALHIPSNMHSGWSWFGLRWWAERGDTADIHAFLAARTTTAPFDPAKDARPPVYDTAVARAYLYLAQHDTAAAMRRFATLPDTLCGGRCELDTVTWGDLLTTHGHAPEADSLLQRGAITPYFDFPKLLRTLALARAAERAGDKKTAIDAYARIEDTWAHADAELQPAVKEARAALTRLSGDHR
jgi:tetratricopeptide (TPR) repeat protein/TolB-like protein